MSHVDVKNLKPSSFEEEYYDQYEYYNLTDKYAGERTCLLFCSSLTGEMWSELFCWFELNLNMFPVNRRLGPERQNKEGGQ